MGITKKQRKEMKEAFDMYDKDKDGQITAKELGDVARAGGANPTEEQLKAKIAEVDANKNGAIEFDEFLVMMANFLVDPSGEVRKFFNQYDTDNDGKINADELAKVLESIGEKADKEEIKQMIKEGDKDGDGEITIEEFMELMVSKQ